LLPEAGSFPAESVTPPKAPPKDFQPDFTFKADGGGFAIIELKCRVPMEAAHEFMEVYARHIKPESADEPSDPDRSRPAPESVHPHRRTAKG
jgi:hypothetical protein